VPTERRTEDLLRELAPQVLGALARRYGHFDACEDAVQEALLAAARQWPADGLPEQPKAWLIRVGSRRLTDLLCAEQSRRRRELADAALIPAERYTAPAADRAAPEDRDDTLVLLFLCGHPALEPAAQVALTLRAVGGLGTEEIARAFLVPEATMSQRILRAKKRISSSGEPFRLPPPADRARRLRAVLQVLYLIFTEGHTATAGTGLQRVELAGEAIRLARLLHRGLPADGEVAGLLALLLLTDARRAARTGPDGAAVPLAEQDRSRWDRAAIDEGLALVTAALARPPLGPYQLQAAIAAVHAEAARAEDTDWPQIVGLYALLAGMSDNPVVTLNRAVAVSMVEGPGAGLALLAPLAADPRIAGHHRLAAVRAHLLERAGELEAARAQYLIAAATTPNPVERTHLESRAAALPEPAAGTPAPDPYGAV
jgi:RNA polymerase sigma factor (sigma-70 family)